MLFLSFLALCLETLPGQFSTQPNYKPLEMGYRSSAPILRWGYNLRWTK